MISIDIRHNIAETLRLLDTKIAKQVPIAAAIALTRTAIAVQADEIKEMRDVFDRPTPYTLGSVGVSTATKAKLEARIYLKSTTGNSIPAAKYLAAEIVGGGRRIKRFESALRAVGALPEGCYAIPASGAKYDAYGNMDRGQIVQILSYFRAFPNAGYRANMTQAGRAKLARGTKKKLGVAYFVGRPGNGKLPLGIWQRIGFAHGSALKPIMIFVTSALYEAVFDFAGVGRRTVARVFNTEFAIAYRNAVASAR